MYILNLLILLYIVNIYYLLLSIIYLLLSMIKLFKF